MNQQQIVYELRTIASRAADATAKLLDATDVQERAQLGAQLADLYARHEELSEQLNRRKRA